MLLSAKTRKAILSIPFAREMSNIIVNRSNRRFYKKIQETAEYSVLYFAVSIYFYIFAADYNK